MAKRKWPLERFMVERCFFFVYKTVSASKNNRKPAYVLRQKTQMFSYWVSCIYKFSLVLIFLEVYVGLCPNLHTFVQKCEQLIAGAKVINIYRRFYGLF
jgi:hypothetical protein